MRNKLILFVAILAGLAFSANAQSTQNKEDIAYTVIANPGEDASSEIRINWHTDLENNKTFCVYTKVGDTEWKKSKKVKAKPEFCAVFDSIYSKKPNGEDFYEDARFWRNTVSLKKLEPGTEYMYSIGTKNDMGEVRYFKTAPRSGKWSAGIISDFHAYTPIPGRVTAAMNMLATLEKQHGKDFDFILHVGDIAAWGGSYSCWVDLYSKSYFKKYMWAGVNGNHDNMTRKNYQSNEFFRHVNNNPLNGYRGEEGVCYHFKYGNALFIMLNNENMRTDEQLTEAQIWVKEVIRNNPAKYVIVVEHYQWFMANNGETSQYGRWKELFDEYGVDLAISGNNHIYARTNAVYADRETDGTKGTVYIQTPSSDNGRGRKLEEWTDNKELIKFRWAEGPHTVGALIMNADDDKLYITLYDRDGNAIDEVSVLAKK